MWRNRQSSCSLKGYWCRRDKKLILLFVWSKGSQGSMCTVSWARLFPVGGVARKETGDFSQLSVFSARMLAEPMRFQQSCNCVTRKHVKNEQVLLWERHYNACDCHRCKATRVSSVASQWVLINCKTTHAFVCQAELSKLRAQLGHLLVRIPAAVTMDTHSGEDPSSCNHGW